MSDLTLFKEALENGKIRKTPDNEASPIDVIMHLTGKSYQSALNELNILTKRHLELIPFLGSYSFGANRPATVMNIEGIIRLIMVMRGIKAAKFRQDAARLICRYMAADITLADDILQRNRNPEDARWLEERAKGKAKRLALTDAIQSHGGERRTYAEVSEINNRAITGMPAKEIQRVRGSKNTRDGMTTDEVYAMGFAELLEASEIGNRNAFGHDRITETVSGVADDVKAVFNKYRRKEVAVEAVVN